MKFGLLLASALVFSQVGEATKTTQGSKNLLENGNFEQPALQSGYRFLDSFPGWKGTGPIEQGVGSVYNKLWGNKVVVELDAHENYCISQKVQLQPGCYHFELDYAGREGHLDSSEMTVYVNNKLMENVKAKENCIYNLDFDISVECAAPFEFKICGTGTSNSYGMTIGNAELTYTQVNGGYGGLTWGTTGWINKPVINIQPVVVGPSTPIVIKPWEPETKPINIEPIYVQPTKPIYVTPTQPVVTPINIEQVYVKPINPVSVQPYVPKPTQINIEPVHVNQITPVQVIPIQPVAPIIKFPTGPITIKCDTGRYLSRCTSCGSGAYTDSASISEINPKNSDAIWTAINYGDKIALRADTGRYLGKCSNCWSQGAYSDSAFVHVPEVGSSNIALWIPEQLNNGKWGLKSSETGKYLSRCTNCVNTAVFSDFAFVQADDCNSSAAQWTVESC